MLLSIYQRSNFESKSQLTIEDIENRGGCCRYIKDRILKANHNYHQKVKPGTLVVVDISKIEF
ncbi:hypothetical protein Dfri01_61520 [Dyadobacter frigoris]|nr:hypothetical protein Dfri01_61520 [Dyadobacter frigoris]